MENASKALIIAGAILLAILLISLGIMIFTQAQDVVSGSGMTEAQISAFNDKFLKYEGKRKGTMVKSLIQEVLMRELMRMMVFQLRFQLLVQIHLMQQQR